MVWDAGLPLAELEEVDGAAVAEENSRVPSTEASRGRSSSMTSSALALYAKSSVAA